MQQLIETRDFMRSQFDQILPDLPKWLQNMIADLGLDVALEVTLLVRVLIAA